MTKGQIKWTLILLAGLVCASLVAAVVLGLGDWGLRAVTSQAPEVLTGLLIALAVDVSFNPVTPVGKDEDLLNQQLGFMTAIVGLVAVALVLSLLAADIDGDFFVRFSGVLSLIAVSLGALWIVLSAGMRLAKITANATPAGDGNAGGGNGGGGGDGGPDPDKPESSDSKSPDQDESAATTGKESAQDPEPDQVPESATRTETRRAPQADLVATTLKKTKSAKKADKKKPKKSGKKQSKQKDKKKKK
jgi:hypothetical protein